MKGLEAKLYEIQIAHFYESRGFFTRVKPRHSCLRQGYWCWKNFLRHPRDLVDYIEKKHAAKYPSDEVLPVVDTRYSGQEK